MKIITLFFLITAVKCNDLFNITGVSPENFLETECYKEYLSLMRADKWNIVRMVDSWSKLPAGLLDGNYVSLGSFEECLNIEAETDTGHVYGKFCFSAIQFGPKVYTDMPWPIHISVCIPHTCHLPKSDNTSMIVFEEKYCVTKYSKTLKVEDWIVLSIIILILSIVVSSTLYEMYIDRYKKERKHLYFLTFSALTNGKKLFSVSKSEEHLGCLNGMRSLTMIWIITGHRYSTLSIFASNMRTIWGIKDTQTYFYLHAAHVATESYFLLSALVVSYSYIKLVHKKRFKLYHAYYFYILRLIRLLPTLYMVYFFNITLLRVVGSGPLYNKVIEMERQKCIDWWWSFFTFTQNYFNYNEVCLVPTWYLSADFQLHLLVPFIIIPFGNLIVNNKRKILYLLMVVTIFTSFIFGMVLNLVLKTESRFFTHIHAPGFMLGLMLGIVLADESMKSIKISKNISNILWVLSLSGMVTLSVFLPEFLFSVSKTKRFIYETFFPFTWCVCVSWIIYACSSKRGGLINKFLSCGVFQVLNKLNYCMYIVHIIIIHISVAMTTEFISYTVYKVGYFVGGDLLYILSASLLLTLTVETPFRKMGLMLLKQDKKKQTTESVENLHLSHKA